MVIYQCVIELFNFPSTWRPIYKIFWCKKYGKFRIIWCILYSIVILRQKRYFGPLSLFRFYFGTLYFKYFILIPNVANSYCSRPFPSKLLATLIELTPYVTLFCVQPTSKYICYLSIRIMWCQLCSRKGSEQCEFAAQWILQSPYHN